MFEVKPQCWDCVVHPTGLRGHAISQAHRKTFRHECCNRRVAGHHVRANQLCINRSAAFGPHRDGASLSIPALAAGGRFGVDSCTGGCLGNGPRCDRIEKWRSARARDLENRMSLRLQQTDCHARSHAIHLLPAVSLSGLATGGACLDVRRIRTSTAWFGA